MILFEKYIFSVLFVVLCLDVVVFVCCFVFIVVVNYLHSRAEIHFIFFKDLLYDTAILELLLITLTL